MNDCIWNVNGWCENPQFDSPIAKRCTGCNLEESEDEREDD